MVCVLIPKRSNPIILDVGCGNGLFSSGWAGDHQVAGLDFSHNLLMLATQKGLKVFMGDIHSLPFASDQFDVVVNAEVIQHLKDLPPTMSELVRITKPGGSLIISPLNAQPIVRGISYRLNLLMGAHRRTPS